MSIFRREASVKRVKHAEMRMKWRVNCNILSVLYSFRKMFTGILHKIIFVFLYVL